jgi:Ca2+-binding RTX toxin-like protein
VTGSNLDDEIRGNAKASHLDGRAGNDLLNGGLGDDILELPCATHYHGGKSSPESRGPRP